MDKSYFGELRKSLESLKKIRKTIELVRYFKEVNQCSIESMEYEFDECFDLENQLFSLESIVDYLDYAIDELETVL